ncbi:eukaryotic cytochrome b561-domain-containing protein [Apodospora peruviana]|uniref:Eukaryotic cytochrome b561-domain-containing protein n=1 Tax=Apodospora peruviana TaxID=516989 RepID=A0AAE0M112_9PEZI|nr:eukaryotic cytochrome b561-domain-containing protein [Apodospora peruviana]
MTSQPTTQDSDAPLAPTESEPLLGRPGDAVQKPNAPMVKNLWLGTGWVAQAGAVLLLADVWSGVFMHKTLPLVSPHPLLQALGAFTLVEAILILQPTTSPETKRLGQRAHASLQLLSFVLFLTGITIIETNKHVNHGEHFHSLHGHLGVITGVLLLGQYLFGFLVWAVPAAFGGEEKAKAMWKYHRYGGYLLLMLVLATIVSAVETDYNKGVLDIKMWTVGLAVVLIVIGVFPRIQLSKLGIQRR